MEICSVLRKQVIIEKCCVGGCDGVILWDICFETKGAILRRFALFRVGDEERSLDLELQI